MNAPVALTMIEPIDTPRVVAMLTPADLLRLAIEKGADLDQLERLMGLQERWEANTARREFAVAMAGFKAEPLTIFKRKQVGYATKDGDFVGYSHAELSDVTDVVGPAMALHKLSYRWNIKQDTARVTVSCIVTHMLGHSEEVTMEAAPDNSGKKNPMQQIASAVTYLQRYTLLAVTGMSTKGMDDDGRGGVQAADDAEDPVFIGFRDASLLGEAALIKHYDANPPPEAFWKRHSPALKAAARAIDARRQT